MWRSRRLNCCEPRRDTDLLAGLPALHMRDAFFPPRLAFHIRHTSTTQEAVVAQGTVPVDPLGLPFNAGMPCCRPHRKLSLLKALGPLTVCIISIALMNIFKW